MTKRAASAARFILLKKIGKSDITPNRQIFDFLGVLKDRAFSFLFPGYVLD